MKSLVTTILSLMILAGSVLLIAACNGETIPDATVTPLPTITITIEAEPTSTFAPTPTPDEEDIMDNEDVRKFEALLKDEKFEQAVFEIEKLRNIYPDNQAVNALLAKAYHEWGKYLIEKSEGEPEDVSEALYKFSKGLSYAPTDTSTYTIYESLEWEERNASGYLQGSIDLENLLTRREEGVSLSEQAELADSMLEQFETSWGDHPGFPGLYHAYIKGLNVAALVYIDLGDAQETREEKKSSWEKAKELCQKGKEVAGEDSGTVQSFASCVTRVEKKINPPPTPTPREGTEPTNGGNSLSPSNKVQIPDVRGSDVGQAQGYLQGLGFNVVVTALSGDVDELCNGMVSYSSPQGGSWVSPGTQVRLFYRDHNLPNRPGCY